MRHVLAVDLRNDPAAIATYRDYHQRVWPEVLDSVKRAGVRAMDIYILGRRLVMVLELPDGLGVEQAFAAHFGSHPRVDEWEALMRTLLERPADFPPGEWWAVMEPIFHFS